MDIKMSIRPSSSTGVLFALVNNNNAVPLSVAVVTKGEDAVSLFSLVLEVNTHVSLHLFTLYETLCFQFASTP